MQKDQIILQSCIIDVVFVEEIIDIWENLVFVGFVLENMQECDLLCELKRQVGSMSM